MAYLSELSLWIESLLVGESRNMGIVSVILLVGWSFLSVFGRALPASAAFVEWDCGFAFSGCEQNVATTTYIAAGISIPVPLANPGQPNAGGTNLILLSWSAWGTLATSAARAGRARPDDMHSSQQQDQGENTAQHFHDALLPLSVA